MSTILHPNKHSNLYYSLKKCCVFIKHSSEGIKKITPEYKLIMWELQCDPKDLPVAMETDSTLLWADTVDGFLHTWYLPWAFICKYDWKAEAIYTF